MKDPRHHLNVLAPREAKPKFDHLQREVERASGGMRFSRREALGLGGLALLAAAAAACGTTSTTGQTNQNSPSGSGSSNPLTGKPLENRLEIYNWSEYDDPSTYSLFKKQPAEAAVGMKVHETYYASNDELLTKVHAGAGVYDIVVPSQNAVAQLIEEKKLMALDTALLPNLSNLDPAWLKASYDPTGQFHVVKDHGITMFYFNNTIVTEDPKTMLDFYNLLPKYVSKGRTNILEGGEEVVPLALMALGLDANTTSDSDFDQARTFLLSIRKGVTTIASAGYIDDAVAGKIVVGQGWNGDVRRIVQGRKKEGDITAIIPEQKSEIWADNWCILANAPHPVAAHAWINWLLTPSTAVTEMNYHNYPIPIPTAISEMPADIQDDPLFDPSPDVTKDYQYVLNVSPEVVQKRTEITTEFMAAG